MSGNKCSYFLCDKNKRNNPGLRIFHFPVTDAQRCKIWVENSGNENLHGLSKEELKNEVLCGDHFERKYFMTTKLASGAVPTKYSGLEEGTNRYENVKVYQGRSSQGATSLDNQQNSSPRGILTASGLHIATPEKVYRESTKASPSSTASVVSSDSDWNTEIVPIQNDTPRKRKLRQRVVALKNKLRSKSSQISQMKKKTQGVEKIQTKLKQPRNLNALAPFSRVLVQMQLYHGRNTPFSKEEQKVAISMFYKSPGLYKFLRRNKVILPAESTIKMWISGFDTKAGFDKNLFARIKQKATTMTASERKCVLLFDEMDIKQFLDFSRKLDRVEGFEDLGELGKKPVLAKKALVLMVRGLYANWKLPVAYFFSEKPIEGNKLQEIITLGLQKIEETSLNVVATVCDQSSSNCKLYKNLDVSIHFPMFLLGTKKYYALFDSPHLIKSLRNNLLNGYFIQNNNKVSIEHVRKIVELDKRSTTGKALLKVTDKHLNPNTFEKMNVKLAAQLFSHSMAAALKTAIRTKELDESAMETAQFIEKIDKLFDALNSQKLYASKACNSAFSIANIHAQKALEDGKQLFSTLQKVNHKTGKINRPPCFDGFLQTINGIRMIFEDGLKDGFKFLFTRRLNQDPLENQFSLYRQSGGYNKNPTARTFKASFKMNATINLLKPPQSNCAEDNDESIILEDSLEDCQGSSSTSTSSVISSVSEQLSDSEVTLEKSAEVYFGGYLIKKVLDKYKCELCRIFLQDELNNDLPVDESLIFFRNYGLNKSFCNLKVPAPTLKAFTEISMRYFSKYVDNYLTKPRFTKRMFNLIKKKLQIILPDWFVGNACNEHRNFILELLIRTLIFKKCKSYSQSTKSTESTRRSKKRSKLQILKKK